MDLLSEESIEEPIYKLEVIKNSEINSLSEADKAFYDEHISSGSTLQFFPKPRDSRSNALFGKLVKNELLTTSELLTDENKETRHIELQFPENTLEFSPGDVCYILPKNDPESVSQMLARANLNSDDLVKITTLEDSTS